MKKQIVFIFLLFAIFTGKGIAQVSIDLSGYPLVTTGWTIGGSAFVVDSEIELTPSVSGQAGHINFNTSENVTACGQFSVDFDYKISSSGGCGWGDGIAFFFINPLTSFTGGGGLGLPSPLTGFVFTMDTYDNDGDGNNPEDELMGYPTSGTYTEGDVSHHISSILTHQSYMTDGNWHHVRITYNGGVIRVYANGATTPSMTGTFPITTAGYFGFSAGTGCAYSVQMVKSIHIVSNTISAIVGTTTLCTGSTTALSDSTTGGTWISGNTSVATVGAGTGIVTGVTTGSAVITYTYNSGACTATTTVNVVTPPGTITGSLNICRGTTTTLSDVTSGGSWSSSNPSVATVGPLSGVVTGLSAGTANITYSTGGTCYVTATVTVNAIPTAISGALSVCAGLTTTLSDGLGGGTWSSSAPLTASVGATTGIVTGVAPGTAIITYALGICSVSAIVTVNASPLPVTGIAQVCVGFTTALADATPGGTWSSVFPAVAPVSATGIVTGSVVGISNISYTLPDGCFSTVVATVNPIPASISGAGTLCAGSITFLFSISPGGTWTSSTPAVATVSGSIVTGISAGVATITHTLSTGCYNTFSITVNPVPAPITGPTVLCVGTTITSSDITPGGFWYSTDPLTDSINIVSGLDSGISSGVTTISYTVGGCSATATVTVNPLPGIIIGTGSICAGSTLALYGPGGGTWSSGDVTIATVDAVTGIVTGVSTGTATIYYTVSSGCAATTVVTVNPSPAAITGPSVVCVGMTITEADATSGGLWTISGPATITSGGVVTGSLGGTAIVTYTAPGGCTATKTVTVNSSAGAIGGANHVCVGGTTILTASGAGSWSSSDPARATVSASGVVTGISAGALNITFSSGTGCFTVFAFTVNPLPGAITGTTHVCVGSCSTLSDAGGIWTATGGATVTAGGSVCGVTSGVASVTYSIVSTGCQRTTAVTVNPLPGSYTVGGGGSFCSGGTGVHITLSGSTPGINYQVYSGGVAVSALTAGTGAVLDFGLFASGGTYTVVATNPATSCSATMTGSAVITVNPLPPLCNVTGGGSFCTGAPGLHVGLGCSSAGISYQLLNGATVTGSPLAGTGAALDFGLQSAAGTYTVLATNTTTGCSRLMSGSATMTVNPAPAAISGPTALCPGTTITLTDASGGGIWVEDPVYLPVVTISSSGVVSGIATGLAVITYELIPSGCYVTTTVNVSPVPGPVLGPATGCVGLTTLYSDAVTGGTWTSSNPSVAAIGSLTGMVTGVTTGTATITYSLGGTSCTVVRTITVNAGPSPVAGAASVCVGGTIPLTDATAGGTWSSSAAATGSISALGIVTGIAAGTTSISYAVGGGCPAIHNVTVNGLPAAISGPAAVCAGSVITETDATTGITWSISPATIATIGISSGIVTGISGGAAIVTATTASGCQVIRTITVNALPSAITGTSHICVGQTVTLTDGTPGGSWGNSTAAVATLTGSGIITGVSPGTDTVTYTSGGTGCAVTDVVTVNSLPSSITGAGSICVGASLTLTDVAGGGTWSSAGPSVASVGSSSGVVTGLSAGTAVIYYTTGGCAALTTVTVIAAPGAISGPASVCVGATVTESDPLAGGTWTSSLPAEATVSASGVVTGISSGTVIISYALSTGCTVIYPVVVNPISPILGTASVCEGQMTLLTDITLGGSWSSSAPAIASINTLGMVTGHLAGLATITYTLPTGCMAIAAVTVNPVPLAITGAPFAVCAGSSITLADASPAGSWSTSDPATATVTGGGVVSGIASGTVTISYAYPSGCAAVQPVTVQPVPPAISGPGVVCVGGSMTLSDGIPGGTWSSSAPLSATVSAATGLVTGIAPGTAIITYTLPAGCMTTTTVTVNTALGAITGPGEVCAGSTITLTAPAAGGTWSSSLPATGTVDGAGTVTGISAGTTVITYSIGSGCTAAQTVTVDGQPSAILPGSGMLCQGATEALLSLPSGGSWTSSNAATAPVTATTGIVTGLATGAATITYTLATGCYTTINEVVNPAPLAITGTLQVCVGNSSVLGDGTTGGTWSSTATAVATIDGTGTVRGISPGISVISYTGAYGCAATAAVTVNPEPTAITGSSTVCQGYTTTFTNGVPGGTWTSNAPAIATAGTATGIITGISAGSTTITYSAGAGCTVTKDITVNPTPSAITGPATVCATESITLHDATGGGTWSSSSVATATVAAATGVVTGVAAGTATISYSSSLGCAAVYAVTVNPMPGAILGNTNVCLGGTVTLSDAVSGGSWSSTVPAVATIGSTGVVSGVSAGSATILYTLPAGCNVSATVRVYTLPLVFGVTGGGTYCNGGTGRSIGLDGSTVGVNYLLYNGVTAVGTFAGSGGALSFGLQTVEGTYTVIATGTASGCSISMSGTAVIGIIPTVAPSVTLHAVPGDTVCTGTAVTYSPVPVNGGLTPGYQWRVNGVAVATGSSYTFIPADGDEVSATMTSSAACPLPATAADAVRVKVDAYGTPGVSISATPAGTVCQGTRVTLHATPIYGGPSPVYTWVKNGAVAATGADYVYAPDNNDNVYCIIQSGYHCRLNSTDTGAAITLTTAMPLVPVVTIHADAGTLISPGQPLTLTATVVNGGTAPTYQWLKNGIPAATGASYTDSSYSYPGEDSVTCVVTGSDICMSAGYQWIFIQVANVGVGSISNTGSGISILPNPNKGEFVIKGTWGAAIDGQVSIEISDMLGQVVYKGSMTARAGRLNERVVAGSTLANGMYLLTLRAAGGSEVLHIVVEQ